MLKKMRWRFIGAAMAAFTAVVLTLLCFVNLWNYHSVTNQQDEALTRLMEIEDQQMPFSSRRGAPPFDDWSHFSPEVQYSLRFFSVHYDADGVVLRVNQDYIASISESDAETYADAVLESGKAQGYESGYRYLVSTTEDETVVLFLNSERELQTMRSLLWITLGIPFYMFGQANLMLSRLIGDIGVSTFSVLSFIYSLANAVLSGVAQGLQPLWGQCYGRKDSKGLAWYFRRGIIINIVLSVLIYGALFFFDAPVIRIFNREPTLVKEATAALPLFALSFVPMAPNLIYTAYFFSTKRTGTANAIAISRGIALKALLIFCLPLAFGTETIWLAPFITELVTLCAAIVLRRTSKLVYR